MSTQIYDCLHIKTQKKKKKNTLQQQQQEILFFDPNQSLLNHKNDKDIKSDTRAGTNI